jgi:formamidopyrimidine-DNA glycosylase
MPELPEVEFAAAQLRGAVVGKQLESVELHHPSLRRQVSPAVVRALAGALVTRVDRRGKHQLLRLDDGRTIHVHFRMTGEWWIGTAADALPRFARATFLFVDGTRVALDDGRALSTIVVHATGEEPELGLGPEPDDTGFDEHWLEATLARRRIAIKSALLDQRVVAGLGNIYAAEALWRARLDPRRLAASLDRAERRRLRTAIRAVIARADGSRYGESTASRFAVYGREGEPCRRCGTVVRRIVQAGRSTYFCPRCQPAWRAPRVSRAPRAARP